MKVECFQCKKVFNKPPSQVKRVQRCFCSVECATLGQLVRVQKTCEVCGCGFSVVPVYTSRYSTCSKPECRAEKKRRGHAAQKREGTVYTRRKARDKERGISVYLRSIWHMYGVSPEKYQEMRAAQNDGCAICHDSSGKLVVDHCHESGAVRGLLCSRCNTGLGSFRDSYERLMSAAKYIATTESDGSVRPVVESTEYDI